MSVLVFYLQVVAVVGICLVVGLVSLVGVDRIRSKRKDIRERCIDAAPHFGLIGAAFVLSMFWRPVGVEVSWTLQYNITDTIYGIEGYSVAWIQSIATTELTWTLSIVYVFGYVFLLVFPLVAYLFLDELRLLRVTALAYVINYVVGLASYSLVVAYGPRNYMPGEVDSLMYIVWPESEILTTSINVNTNVFPSLHTSLAVTVVFLAWYTRDSYPGWFYVSALLGGSVVFSTMYLGLHWVSDVVAGFVLAFASVTVASRMAAEKTEHSVITQTGRRILTSP